MFGLDYVLALALLSAPAEIAEGSDSVRAYADVRPTLQALAVQWEILDPKEVRYTLARPEDFVADVLLVRRRFQELAQAPPLGDAQRFPDRNLVNEFLTANRSYQQFLGVRQPVELAHWWELRAAVQETERLYQIWDKVRDAHCEFYYVNVRRQALKDLRSMIGDEAYYSAKLPPSVPVWRYQRVP
jgi:hypothetical protein